LGLGPAVRGKLLDLSPSGCGFESKTPFKEGEALEIEISHVGHSRKVQSAATVCRAWKTESGHWRLGCVFDKRIPYAECAEFAR
jgi:hypothetical protein